MDGAAPTPWLGRKVAGHFDIRSAGKKADRRHIGSVGIRMSRFGLQVGRSLSTRRILAGGSNLRTGSIGRLPVSPPPLPLLTVARDSASGESAFPATLHASRAAAAVAPKVPPRGLPRVTGRRAGAGPPTGPGQQAPRLTGQNINVRLPAEVRASGPMLTGRELEQQRVDRTPRAPTPPSGSERELFDSPSGRGWHSERPGEALAGPPAVRWLMPQPAGARRSIRWVGGR